MENWLTEHFHWFVFESLFAISGLFAYISWMSWNKRLQMILCFKGTMQIIYFHGLRKRYSDSKLKWLLFTVYFFCALWSWAYSLRSSEINWFITISVKRMVPLFCVLLLRTHGWVQSHFVRHSTFFENLSLFVS